MTNTNTTQAQAVPEGFVAVPVRPTNHMLTAGREALRETNILALMDAWKAMLSASPALPQQGEMDINQPEQLSDEEILRAVHKACGTGRVALSWINNDGKEAPTDVAKCFARFLLNHPKFPDSSSSRKESKE